MSRHRVINQSIETQSYSSRAIGLVVVAFGLPH